jgi:serine/threonine protein kinase
MRNDHQNIIRITDHGVVSIDKTKVPFFIMPYYPSTLRHLMLHGMTHSDILTAFSKMLDGVEAAHLRKIVHRDLKPENVLCADEIHRVVVADFGIAHFEEDELHTAVETKAADRLANFAYAAPEQRRRGEAAGPTADIYALGLILNEMFTGHVIQGAGYKRIGEAAPGYAYLDELVDKMVQQIPSQRLQSIDEVKRTLIGRRNSFVTQQKLDTAKKQAVPRFEPRVVEPVTIIASNWVAGVLTLTLSRVPEAGWLETFRNSSGGRSYTSMLHWSQVSFEEIPRDLALWPRTLKPQSIT